MRPRVFISSTFYDLRQVRADLEHFIREEMGYEPILHERGQIPYGASQKLEDSAYREVDLSDILISIVGSRFGSGSRQEPYSISQRELKRALDKRIQVFIFVLAPVQAEYQTYKLNKDAEGIRYSHVNDRRVYEFLDEIYALPQNNAVQAFETARDIIDFLRLQWAGLFRSYLEQDRLRRDEATAIELRDSLRTAQQLVEFLSKQNQDKDEVIREILVTNHPVFARLRSLLNIRHPIYFRTASDLVALLLAQGFTNVERAYWDDPTTPEFVRNTPTGYELLSISGEIFGGDDFALRVIAPEDFKDEWVQLRELASDIDEEPPGWEWDGPDGGHDLEPDFDPPVEQPDHAYGSPPTPSAQPEDDGPQTA